MPKTITVLVPTAKAGGKDIPVAPRVHDLNDKVVGLLWNNKPNGDFLLLRIAEQLSQKFRLTTTDIYEGRRSAANDAAIMEELMSNSDVVINAIAD